jgi:hypothetical protein
MLDVSGVYGVERTMAAAWVFGIAGVSISFDVEVAMPNQSSVLNVPQ